MWIVLKAKEAQRIMVIKQCVGHVKVHVPTHNFETKFPRLYGYSLSDDFILNESHFTIYYRTKSLSKACRFAQAQELLNNPGE